MAEADWLRLQKKIFGRYIEQRLKEGGIKYEVKDIVEEMKSGQLMIDLLEAMSGHKCKKQLKPAKMRIQQIENANVALDFVRDSGVDLSKIRATAEDIVDGKEKIVFALIFQIIVKYLKIDEGDEGKAIDIREALNLWLHNKTHGYKHVSIQDFTKSFHDGMAFLALVHKMRPKLIDYDARDPGMKESNLELALELGAKYLNIPKYLSASDIHKLDEISMIVYLTDWYTGVTLLQKQDIAARRIGKLVDVTELHDKLRADYKSRATCVRDWLDTTIVKLNERKFDDTLAGVKQLLEQFYTYKKTEKSAKVSTNFL
jgi:spectrin beta